MKLLQYIKSIILSILILFTGVSLYAEEDVLMLYDSVNSFPVLKGLFDSGFFTGFNNLQVQYIPEGGESEKQATGSGDFSLTSYLKLIGDVEFSSFLIQSDDSLKRPVNMTWGVPAKDKFRRDKSIRSMVNFARSVQKSAVPDALAGIAGRSNEISEINTLYTEDGTAVSGYDLTIHTGFSSRHRFFRTLTELTLLNSVGVANYWINKDDNMEDWRYKYRWKDAWPRFRDGWSLDTNAFRTNTLYHIYSGAIYYQTARSNEYGIIASTAWAFTGSMIWEYLGEWREKTSGNDMIFTTFGGAILGESFTQSSIYIERCMPNSVYGTILSFLLDPMRILNRALDRALDGDYKVRIVIMNPAAQAIIDKSRKN